jgi:hypothetical protein
METGTTGSAFGGGGVEGFGACAGTSLPFSIVHPYGAAGFVEEEEEDVEF